LTDEVLLSEIYLTSCKSQELQAKIKELDQWKQRNVYKEIVNNGEDFVSLRWVVTQKIINDNPITKARLCARGFEEDQNFRTDSPTCSREGIRVILTLIASKGWKCNSLDVKTAFLQGKVLERVVIVKPPKEAQTDKLWLLQKCVYGLADASRYWYLKVKEELCKLGGKPSKYDQGIFYFCSGKQLIGIIILFVDDLLWAGVENFNQTISKLKLIFQVGAEHKKCFKYIGINIDQNYSDMSINIDQLSYTNTINKIPLTREEILNPKRKLNHHQVSSLRSVVGQLNWLANITRPEISFQVSSISSKFQSATISEIKDVNKVVEFVRNNPSSIKFPPLNPDDIKVTMYSDASFNNLDDGYSQGGYIVLLSDKTDACPVAWKSNKLRRVARSTLAAETLALTEGCDAAFLITNLAKEAGLIKNQKILAYTDNKSLFDCAATSSQVADKRLRVEISAIREMKEREEVSIEWVSKDKQLADCLTKRGASTVHLKNGCLH